MHLQRTNARHTLAEKEREREKNTYSQLVEKWLIREGRTYFFSAILCIPHCKEENTLNDAKKTKTQHTETVLP